MDAIGATQVGLKAPPPLAAAASAEVDPFLDALGFGVLGPLAVTDMRRIDSPAGPAFELDFTADNGTATYTIDAASRHLLSFSLAVGDPGHQVLGEGSFERIGSEGISEGLSFDPAGTRAVADFAALEASAYPLGQPAPDVALTDLAGDTVSLADLRGSVVVLDFWATWCVPCWSALPEIESLAAWAETADFPVAVYSVSTLETMPDLEQQRTAVREFLAGRDLAPPVLLDADDAFFKAMHTPGLPSTVLIGPDGTLAGYHSGVLEDMAATLQAEATKLAG